MSRRPLAEKVRLVAEARALAVALADNGARRAAHRLLIRLDAVPPHGPRSFVRFLRQNVRLVEQALGLEPAEARDAL